MVRHHVERSRPPAASQLGPYRRLEVATVERGVRFGDGGRGDVEQAGGTGDADIARAGDQQSVRGPPDESAQREDHRLLATYGDHDGLRGHVNALIAAQPVGDHLADPSARRAVLEHRVLDLAGRKSPLREVVKVAADAGEDLLEVEEAIVRPAGGERDGVRVPGGDLVEEVHGVQYRIG